MFNNADYQWNDPVDAEQDLTNRLTNNQREVQALVIRDSHNVQVAQTEAQALILVQVALQAAIEAAIVVLSTQDADVRALQQLSQNLSAIQLQNQSITIVGSDGITVTQTELQVDVVVQAAVNLLAQLSARLV